MSSQIKTNTSSLESILNKIKNLSLSGGIDTNDGTALDTDIAYGKIAYVKGERLEGKITNAENGFSDADRYLIQQQTLNDIANQSMELAGTTGSDSTAEIISGLESANEEILAQVELIDQLTTALEGKAASGGSEVTSYVWRNVVGNGTQVMNLSADKNLLAELYNDGSFIVMISDQSGHISYNVNIFHQGRYNPTMADGIQGHGYYSTDKVGGIAWSSSCISTVAIDTNLGMVSIVLSSPYYFDDGEYIITLSKL